MNRGIDRKLPSLQISATIWRGRFRAIAQFAYHDLYVPALKRTRHYDFELASVALTAEELAAADATVIVTDHTCLDYNLIARASRLVIDTRNATRGVTTGREKIVYA